MGAELPHESDLEARSNGATNEVELAAFFSLFLALLLGAVLLSNKVAHHWHIQWVPEAAAVIALGIVAGVGCRFSSGLVAKTLMGFDATTFFVMLLPPIIFNSGYTMKRRYFFENIRSILWFAVVGTFVSTVVVGVLLYAVGRLGISVQLSIAECLTFGALISATDPVSTLAIFQELHVDPTLFYIVFGESVLNDAVGIVLFTTFAKFIGFTYTASSTLVALLDFVLIFVGSTLVGVLLGLLSALLFKHFDFKTCTLHEVGAYILFAYLPFLVSTAIDMSGVVSILFAGITMKHYTHNNISTEAQDICSRIFSSLAHLTETIVFLNLGLTLFSVTHGYHVGLVVCSVLFCFLGRAAHVYPLSKYLNRSLAEPLSLNQQHMLWFSGLRGAVAYALASSFPGAHRDYIVATTMVIVLLTVFFMGGSTVAVLERLHIARLSPEQEATLDRSVRPIDRMPLLQHDAKYLVPFFTKLHRTTKVFSFERSDVAAPVDDDDDGDLHSVDDSIAATDCVKLAKASSPQEKSVSRASGVVVVVVVVGAETRAGGHPMLLQAGLAHRPRALSLMTFNVLAPCYFRHGGRVESSDRAAFLSRAHALIRAIDRERCDVVCLQEYWFDREYQAAFRRAFYPTHYVHALKRPGDKEDGLAMFVNKHKFDVHHVQHIDFDHAGDRVALLLHLATKWNRHSAPLLDRSFLVVNAHLTFPHSQAYKDMRLEQIQAVVVAVREYVTRESLESVPILMCGDFNDSHDAVHSFVANEGFASVFAHLNGREARITHCNHNNREVGVDFVFASHLPQDVRSTRERVQELVADSADAFVLASDDDSDDNDDEQTTTAGSRLQLVPRDCHLSPRRLADTTRLKRPSFGHDWRTVTHPEDDHPVDDDVLVDYWRLLSDHRPLVAAFDVLPPVSPSDHPVG